METDNRGKSIANTWKERYLLGRGVDRVDIRRVDRRRGRVIDSM